VIDKKVSGSGDLIRDSAAVCVLILLPHINLETGPTRRCVESSLSPKLANSKRGQPVCVFASVACVDPGAITRPVEVESEYATQKFCGKSSDGRDNRPLLDKFHL